ncbi:uncharacterized protein LOC133885607 [Phragmites australis]|uniref:uncharacterized protein LOC133885607 n=1 Tax=Phragmites australis TaxID=29695 RepID=UPI002D791AB4|nr:uncharacterized protein LOC133885607 [Phragmites australis]
MVAIHLYCLLLPEGRWPPTSLPASPAPAPLPSPPWKPLRGIQGQNRPPSAIFGSPPHRACRPSAMSLVNLHVPSRFFLALLSSAPISSLLAMAPPSQRRRFFRARFRAEVASRLRGQLRPTSIRLFLEWLLLGRSLSADVRRWPPRFVAASPSHGVLTWPVSSAQSAARYSNQLEGPKGAKPNFGHALKIRPPFGLRSKFGHVPKNLAGQNFL